MKALPPPFKETDYRLRINPNKDYSLTRLDLPE
jgi:hypothetical protein